MGTQHTSQHHSLVPIWWYGSHCMAKQPAHFSELPPSSHQLAWGTLSPAGHAKTQLKCEYSSELQASVKDLKYTCSSWSRQSWEPAASSKETNRSSDLSCNLYSSEIAERRMGTSERLMSRMFFKLTIYLLLVLLTASITLSCTMMGVAHYPIFSMLERIFLQTCMHRTAMLDNEWGVMHKLRGKACLKSEIFRRCGRKFSVLLFCPTCQLSCSGMLREARLAVCDIHKL